MSNEPVPELENSTKKVSTKLLKLNLDPNPKLDRILKKMNYLQSEANSQISMN